MYKDVINMTRELQLLFLYRFLCVFLHKYFIKPREFILSFQIHGLKKKKNKKRKKKKEKKKLTNVGKFSSLSQRTGIHQI